MRPERVAADQEKTGNIRLAPPAIELLLAVDNIDDAWPETIANDPSFVDQIKERLIINERLDAVMSRLPRPDMPLERALSENLVTEEQLADMYEALSDLLENPDYRRALLYVPFEFLPRESWKPGSKTLARATERFKAVYMAAWESQLWTHDVRANFMDGDVLEVESRTGDLPRVVKAAHLIPKLVEAEFMQPADVIGLRESIKDGVLRESIDDALVVLADMGFVAHAELARMDISSERPAGRTDDVPRITEKRAAWLRQEERRAAIEVAAKDIAESSERSLAEDAGPEQQQAFIMGVRDAIESLAHSDPEQARRLYANHEKTLLDLWQKGQQETREALATAFYRLYALSLVKKEQLATLELSLPSLAGPASKNLKAMTREVEEAKSVVAAIESDLELSRVVYPVIIVGGSRLKGYGSPSADIDVAVLIRPDARFEDREEMRKKLKEKFSYEKMGKEIMEIWVERTPTGLAVRDLELENDDPLVPDGHYASILFGGAWEGEARTIKELREKLLVPYFYNTDKENDGRDARVLHLQDLERDILQYRLMHTGYARFFPAYGGIRTPNAGRIDGKSMFWDSGYRQTALKLFASRVFLPKLTRGK